MNQVYPMISLSKFNNLPIPAVATLFDGTNEYRRFEVTEANLGDPKGDYIAVQYGKSNDTETHYLQVTLCRKSGHRQTIHKHRFRADTVAELICKLEDFLSVPRNTFKHTILRKYIGGGYEILRVNSTDVVQFLAKCKYK